jgi:hypothetical protein
MRYCTKTVDIIKASYITLSVEEIVDAIKEAGLRPRTVESVTKYILSMQGNSHTGVLAAWSKANPEEYRAGTLLSAAQYRAGEKGIPCTITKDWITAKIKAGRCEATGVKFVVKTYEAGAVGKKINPNAPSLDQIIPGKGYTPENTQVVTDQYNKMKNDRTTEETYRLALAIVSKRVNSITVKM